MYKQELNFAILLNICQSVYAFSGQGVKGHYPWSLLKQAR